MAQKLQSLTAAQKSFVSTAEAEQKRLGSLLRAEKGAHQHANSDRTALEAQLASEKANEAALEKKLQQAHA